MNSNACAGNLNCTNTNGRITGGTAAWEERSKVIMAHKLRLRRQDNVVAQKANLILGCINSMTTEVIISLY